MKNYCISCEKFSENKKKCSECGRKTFKNVKNYFMIFDEHSELKKILGFSKQGLTLKDEF